MSRGLGRVQLGILEVLERGPQDAYALALHVGASPGSLGRALRTLRRSGQVRFLGFAGRGVGVWCLPEHEEAARAALLPKDLAVRVARLMGVRFARKLARQYVSDL